MPASCHSRNRRQQVIPELLGVAFKLTTRGSFSVLHTFTDGADGGSPVTDLTEDGKGNLYGGAQGGIYGSGVIFKITP